MSLSSLMQEKLHTQQQQDLEQYISLPLPPAAVILVQGPAACQSAWAELQTAPLLGIDVEARPALSNKQPSPSLLQVSNDIYGDLQQQWKH